MVAAYKHKYPLPRSPKDGHSYQQTSGVCTSRPPITRGDGPSIAKGKAGPYTRDALYGGRIEAMRLHYRIDEDVETIQYCDVKSLYPFICKYFKFPIGHPIIM